MGLFTKIDLYSFADFYHRFATTGLTMDEMFDNFIKYKDKPRDMNEPVKVPGKLKVEIKRPLPPATRLYQLLNVACEIGEVEKADVNSKKRDREFVTVRQWVCYAALQIGWEPADIHRLLKWDRTGVYHKAKKCHELAQYTTDYRNSLNDLLQRFGQEPIIA